MMRAPWWYVRSLRGAAALLSIAVLLLTIVPRAEAAAIPLVLPANVAASGTGFVTRASTVGIEFAGAAFNSGLTTQVAGKAVTVPAAWRLASNAGQVATTAMRANPAWATAALLTWLVAYGIEKCTDGTWCHASNGKPQEGATGTVCYSGSGGCSVSYPTLSNVSYQQYVLQAVNSDAYAFETPICQDGAPCTLVDIYYRRSINGQRYSASLKMTNVNKDIRPATDTDWAPVPAAVPDWVHSWLANKGIGLPLDPAVNPATQTVPLSDPYLDPVTGKRYRDVGYVTPSPSSPTKTADLQVAKQEVDAEGNPIVDPTTGGVKAPEKTDDPCLAHPNRIGCMETGDVPDGPDLQQSEKTITITPDSGWGPETMACPADIVSTLRSGGGVVAYSFKAQCDFADGVRAPVIAIAWVVAVLIALGVGSKGGGD